MRLPPRLIYFPLLLLLSCPFMSVAVEQEAPPSTSPKPVSLSEAREMVMTGSYKEAIEAFEFLAKEPKTNVAATLGLAEAKMRILAENGVSCFISRASASISSRVTARPRTSSWSGAPTASSGRRSDRT